MLQSVAFKGVTDFTLSYIYNMFTVEYSQCFYLQEILLQPTNTVS